MTGAPRPYTLVAELTYRCPLNCVYCSNPLDFASRADGLTTADWTRVFVEAKALGVMQVHLTGGEPVLRKDLVELVGRANDLELYTSLITSGVSLSRERLMALAQAGLCSLQLSIQGIDEAAALRYAGREALAEKLQVAAWTRELGLPLTLNVVIHRGNIESLPALIQLAEDLNADRLELANTQYLAWALVNRDALLPTDAQLSAARGVARAAKERLRSKMEVLFVLPDYYSEFPRACMDGWAKRYIVVTPAGEVLPCHLAHTIVGLHFDNVREHSLSSIWQDSVALNQFRGEAWLPEPCQSCERRSIDFGGCRCQAYHLTAKAHVTDPACSRSPDHGLIHLARAKSESTSAVAELRYRRTSVKLPVV